MSRPGVNGEAVQVSREGALPVVGVVEGGPHGRGRARLARRGGLALSSPTIRIEQ